MAITGYKVVKAPLGDAEILIGRLIADGWQPLGTSGTTAKAGNYQPTAANISDAGAFGRQLLQAADQAAAKALLGIE